MTNKTERGRIELVCGCMFSGKSLRLVECWREATQRGQTTVAFKHGSDDRYAEADIVTHNGRRIAAIATSDAEMILSLSRDADLVLIDEVQFYDLAIVETCRSLAAMGKQVVVAGLDLDAWGLPFEPMPQLEAIADVVSRTEAVCARCNGHATRTQRLCEIIPNRMIGGPESYEPRCEKCFKAPPLDLRC